MFPRRALVADDNTLMQRLVQLTLESAGYVVTAVSCSEDAVDEVRRRSFDLAVLDVHMPGESGIEALQKIRALAPSTVCLMMSGDDSQEEAALDAGAARFLRKGTPTFVDALLGFDAVDDVRRAA